MNALRALGDALAWVVNTLRGKRAAKAAAEIPRGKEIQDGMSANAAEIKKRAHGA